MVDLVPGRMDPNVSRGTYVVERLLPPTEAGTPQYRVKHAGDGHERAFREDQLAARQAQGSTTFTGSGLNRTDGSPVQSRQEKAVAADRSHSERRAERRRLKRVRKDAKLRKQEEAVARRKAMLDTNPSVEPEPTETDETHSG